MRPLDVVLVSPYELGRQPFGLAEPAAWLAAEGCRVRCVDLSIDRLDAEMLAGADLVGVHLAMHTATRIAAEAFQRMRALAPRARFCVFGLYAPVNEDLFRRLGADAVLGGEVEPALVSLARRVGAGDGAEQIEPLVALDKIAFRRPDRSGLPPLSKYARLLLPGGGEKTVGFAEASRGCKHLCRHCPIVPVYEGKFRVVPVEVVMDDVRQQVAAGAEHVSFGDPDFLNGPTHALRVVRALAAEYPGITWDATIKIEHIVRYADLLPGMRECGCLFLTSAVEAVDDRVLDLLAKNHTAADFERAVALTREADVALAPTFVAFTPWTTLDGYLDLLRALVRLRLVESVPPIQLAIRLLVPRGSHLLRIEGFESLVGAYDETTLGHPWRHADARVDALQVKVQRLVEAADAEDRSRRETFEALWALAHEAAGAPAPALAPDLGAPVPRHSEPWYCCAEPTEQQLAGI